MHITASVFVNDDEVGPDHDFGVWLGRLAPFNSDPNVYCRSNLQNRSMTFNCGL